MSAILKYVILLIYCTLESFSDCLVSDLSEAVVTILLFVGARFKGYFGGFKVVCE